LDRRHHFGRGRAFALYVMAYTVGRFWVEAMRDDTAHHFLGMRVNNWTSIIVFVGALIYFLRVRGPQERLVVSEEGEIQVAPVEGAPTATDSPMLTDGASKVEAVDAELVNAEQPPATAGPPAPATVGEPHPSKP
jgi:hypothetical protein